MESFRKNLSERNLSEGIFQEQLYDPTEIIQFQKVVSERFLLNDSTLKDYGFAKLAKSFRMESFRRNLFQKQSF
jgi:hypothetical protein